MKKPEAAKKADKSQGHRDHVEHPIGPQSQSPCRHRRVNDDGRQGHENQSHARPRPDVTNEDLQQVWSLFLALVPAQTIGAHQEKRWEYCQVRGIEYIVLDRGEQFSIQEIHGES